MKKTNLYSFGELYGSQDMKTTNSLPDTKSPSIFKVDLVFTLFTDMSIFIKLRFVSAMSLFSEAYVWLTPAIMNCFFLSKRKWRHFISIYYAIMV
jgi:hypothetical protein